MCVLSLETDIKIVNNQRVYDQWGVCKHEQRCGSADLFCTPSVFIKHLYNQSHKKWQIIAKKVPKTVMSPQLNVCMLGQKICKN